MKRRDWIQKSLLSSSAILLAPQLLGRNETVNTILRLHWNENPFGPSKYVIKKVQEAVPLGNLYWDERNNELCEKLASKHGLKSDQYLLTSGSTEVLSLIGQHVGLQKGEIIMGDQSFPTIALFGERCGAKITKVNMAGNYLDLNAMKNAISDDTKLIFICNPNNPTSTELDKSQLEQFCRSISSDILICVDEAYIEFSKNGTDNSLIKLIDELPNLIIARTFSKAYGLAGFRLGYAISQSHNIDALRRRYPALGMSPGLLPLVAGIAALDDQDFIKDVVKNTNEGKSIMYNAFRKWNVDFADSSTNFLYVHKGAFVSEIRPKLADQNIWITQWPTMKDHIRISVGKSKWMQTLVTKMGSLRA